MLLGLRGKTDLNSVGPRVHTIVGRRSDNSSGAGAVAGFDLCLCVLGSLF
jgi:hypothetical protein